MSDGDSYPVGALFRTILLWVCFFAMAMCEVMKGPTLLDLKDLLGVNISEISIIIPVGSFGGLTGSFLIGLVMDKLERFRYAILAFVVLLMGLTTSLLPYSPSLAIMCCVAFFLGFSSGAFDAGGNVLLLDLWKGRDSGPYMHTLHFTFGLGAFVAPLVAKPFLLNSEDPELLDFLESNGNNNTDLNNLTSSGQSVELLSATNTSETTTTTSDWWPSSGWTILTLFPVVGCLSSLLSLVFLSYFCHDICRRLPQSNSGAKTAKSIQSEAHASTGEETNSLTGSCESEVVPPRTGRNEPVVLCEQLSQKKKLLLVLLTCVFFFLYVGVEVAYGTFIPAFSVKSKLGMSRQEGSDMAAIFWGCFAGTRGLAIFASIVLLPEIIMWTSFLTSLGGSLWLAVYAESSVLSLQVGSALMGIGFSSIFATGLLWLEKRVIITNRIGSSIFVSSSIGAKTLPIIIGQTVEEYPMSLMYCNLGVVAGCGIIFCIMTLLGGRSVMVPAPLAEHTIGKGEEKGELVQSAGGSGEGKILLELKDRTEVET